MDPFFEQKRKELKKQQILRQGKRDILFSKLVKVESAIEKGDKLEIQQLNLLLYEGAAQLGKFDENILDFISDMEI